MNIVGSLISYINLSLNDDTRVTDYELPQYFYFENNYVEIVINDQGPQQKSYYNGIVYNLVHCTNY